MRFLILGFTLLWAAPSLAQQGSYWSLGTGAGGTLSFLLDRPQRGSLADPPPLSTVDGSVLLPPIALSHTRLGPEQADVLEFELHLLRALAAIALSKRLDLMLTARHLWQVRGSASSWWMVGPNAGLGLVSGGAATGPILSVGGSLAIENPTPRPRQRVRALLELGLRFSFLPSGAVPRLQLSLGFQGRSRLGPLPGARP